MKKTELKILLDELVIKYEAPDFIKDDPVQFPHRFDDKKDIEIAGLIASSLAYGKREHFIQVLSNIFSIIENKPYEFCNEYDFKKDKALFCNISYRYTQGIDIALLFNSISKIIKKYDSLEALFLKEYDTEHENIKLPLTYFADKLVQSSIDLQTSVKGLEFLLPNPRKGSACKRLNLYLKWMVRSGPVDLGIWGNIDKNRLLIPLDVHVARLSRELQLTSRKSNDWKTAEEITAILKQLDPNDPTKYDFALFGYGVNKGKL